MKRRQIQPRQKKFAQGLMAGKTKVRAALDAGYSESYAYKSSFAMIERPQIKTFLTEAFLAKGLTPEKMIQPVLDGFKAKLKVFKREAGGLVLTNEPDHEIRLKSYDRVVAAFGAIPREVEMPAPARPGLVVIIGRESDRDEAAAKVAPADQTARTSSSIDVVFRREKTDSDRLDY